MTLNAPPTHVSFLSYDQFPVTVTTLAGLRLEPARTKFPAVMWVDPVYVHVETMNTTPGPVEVTPPVPEIPVVF